MSFTYGIPHNFVPHTVHINTYKVHQQGVNPAVKCQMLWQLWAQWIQAANSLRIALSIKAFCDINQRLVNKEAQMYEDTYVNQLPSYKLFAMSKPY